MRAAPAPSPMQSARLPRPLSSLACSQANRMPAIRKASRLSRQTTKNALPMISLASCCRSGVVFLFRHDPSLRRFRMEIVEELVGAGFHRMEDQAARDARGKHGLLPQFQTFELGGAWPSFLIVSRNFVLAGTSSVSGNSRPSFISRWMVGMSSAACVGSARP